MSIPVCGLAKRLQPASSKLQPLDPKHRAMHHDLERICYTVSFACILESLTGPTAESIYAILLLCCRFITSLHSAALTAWKPASAELLLL